MPEDEFDRYMPELEESSRFRLGVIPRDNEPAAERCVEMLSKEMRTPCVTAGKSYLAAARLFALAAERDGR